MLGFEFLTIGFIILVVALYYILDYVGIVEKLIPSFSGVLPRSPVILAVAVIAAVMTSGIITFETVSEEWEGIRELAPPTAAAGQQFQYEIPIVGMEEDGTAFTDATYAVHLISAKGTLDGRTINDIYANPAAPFKAGEGDLALLYALTQAEYDNGLTTIPGAYAETSTAAEFADTIASGLWEWTAVTASIGDEFFIYGRYDTSLGQGEYEPFVKKITITGTNPDQGEFSLSDNRVRVYKISTPTIYNFAETSVAGYSEDEDAAAADKLIEVDYYANANHNRSVDTHLYIDLTANMKSSIDLITISNDDGEFARYSKFTDTTNLNTDDWRFESAPSAAGTVYYVGILPDSLRTATTDKDKVGIEMQYDHTGDTVTPNKQYFKLVQFARFGSDFHIDADTFWLDVATNVTDGWT
jgi:hypothetical protein